MHPLARLRMAVSRLPEGLTPGERLVFVALVAHTDEAGQAHPAMATLAKFAGMSNERSARRAVAKLEALGLVARTKAGGGVRKDGKGVTNVFDIPPAANGTRTEESGLSRRKPDQPSQEPGPARPDIRTGESGEGPRRNIEETRALARDGISDFLKLGLLALEARCPRVAATWGARIAEARVECGTLIVKTKGRHAADFLRIHHADDLVASFCPKNGIARVVFEAKQ